MNGPSSYESWVQFASSRIAPRVDLAPLADRITPRLFRDAPGATQPVDDVVERMIESLRTGPAAWDPYGSQNPRFIALV